MNNYDELMKIDNMINKENPIIWKLYDGRSKAYRYYEVKAYCEINNIIKLEDVLTKKILFKADESDKIHSILPCTMKKSCKWVNAVRHQ